MRKELVFLLEEESAKAMLSSMLPRLLHADIQARFIPFEGKQDLEKQLLKRLRGYQNPLARFIVLRDQDGTVDCVALKSRLAQHCIDSGKAAQTKVRIACKELETFYLADLAAVERALGMKGLTGKQESRKFRDPDYLGNPSQELSALTQRRYQKVGGSREIGQHLTIDNERSASFKNLINAIRQMQNELMALDLE